jgi:type IV pilus assembly protein PilW
MIAMTIGLLIVAAVGSVYLGNKQTYLTSDVVSRLQDEARYATMKIRASVQQAGYFGRLENPVLINGGLNSGSDLPTLTGDCAPGWHINLTRFIEAPNTAGGNPYLGTCLNNSSYTRQWVPGTDLLIIRRAASNAVDFSNSLERPTNASNHGHIYLRADINHGELYIANATANPEGYDNATVEDRRLITEMYHLTPNQSGMGGQADGGSPAGLPRCAEGGIDAIAFLVQRVEEALGRGVYLCGE